MQPGLAGYPGQYGNALIKKESLDRFIHTLRNKPVIINHKDNIQDDDIVGEVLNVWYNPDDGWYWCDGIIYDKTAINLIENRGWSVSSSYNFTKYNDEGGSENNVPYDIEFLDGEFDHLAIVENPRYERANIVFNSKVNNTFEGHEGRPGQVGGSLPRENNVIDLSNKFSKTPTLEDVKKYVNELVQKGAKFVTLNPDWFVDTKVNSKRKGHIVYSDKWHKMSDSERDRHNKYVMGLEELLKNAEYIDSKENTKTDIKPDVEKYHYFKTIAKIGQNNYEIIFDTEQYRGESEKKPQIVHLYNIHEIKRASVRAESDDSIKNTIGNSNIILADFTPKLNPFVKEDEDSSLSSIFAEAIADFILKE